MPDQPEPIDVQFPTNGVAISSGFFPDRPKTSQIAHNVRAFDTISERQRGGSRAGIAKYPNAILPNWTTGNPVQHLAQLTILDADLVISSFENYDPSFIPDPSSNNFPNGNPPGSVPDGYGIRNPGAYIWPTGSGGMPVRNRPNSARQRLQVVPSSTTVLNGSIGLLNITLTSLPGGSFVGSGLVTVFTIPPKRSGDGLTGTTNGSGFVSLSVLEPLYEGPVLYLVSHRYVNTAGKLVTCSGTATIKWVPNYTLSLASQDGTSLPAGTAKHNLIATLTNTSTGKPVSGRKILLQTNPKSRTGDLVNGITDSKGNVTFGVSDSTSEVVTYTASMTPKPNSYLPLITSTLDITWGLGGQTWLIDVVSVPQTNSAGGSTLVSLHLHSSISNTPGVGYALTIQGFDADTGFNDLNCNGLVVTTDGSGNASFSTSQPDPVNGVISVSAMSPDDLGFASDQANTNWT